jgi:hypothetical protein
MTLALLSVLDSAAIPDASLPRPRSELIEEVRAISLQLSQFRLSDIAPRDEEAEAHALEHIDSDLPVGVDGDVQVRHDMEGIEDLLAGLSAGGHINAPSERPSANDLVTVRGHLERLTISLGLQI